MTTVVHCRKSKYDIYVGRPSKWGNPFPVGPYTREEALDKYEEWIQTQDWLLKDIVRELKGKILACWRKPQQCHGDILAYLADNL